MWIDTFPPLHMHERKTSNKNYNACPNIESTYFPNTTVTIFLYLIVLDVILLQIQIRYCLGHK
jgi:hypothetical protein